jgi:hypothetical protein
MSEDAHYIELEQAALRLRVSPRLCRELFLRHGFPIFHLGPKTKRVSLADLDEILRLSAEQRVSA